jgi:hypothetical protein
MPKVGFEPAVLAAVRALDRSATVIGGAVIL